ncbi:MAG TPA: hypothetical protein VGU20_00280 [Stellaceae bacterium]|nr:hypothetical protein [Stellaceae bacterium]
MTIAASADQSEAKVQCIVCRDLIRAGARICPTCKSWQDKWRNGLTFGASIAGFITLLATGIAFVFSKGVELYSILSWKDDIKVVELTLPGKALFLNSGSGTALLSRVEIHWEQNGRPESVSRQIGQTIENRAFYTFIDDEPMMKGGFVGTPNGDGRPFLDHAATADALSPEACFGMIFFSENNPALRQVSEHYALTQPVPLRVATVKAQAALSFYSSRDGSIHSSKFPVLIAFVDLGRCQSGPASPSPKTPAAK